MSIDSREGYPIPYQDATSLSFVRYEKVRESEILPEGETINFGRQKIKITGEGLSRSLMNQLRMKPEY